MFTSSMSMELQEVNLGEPEEGGPGCCDKGSLLSSFGIKETHKNEVLAIREALRIFRSSYLGKLNWRVTSGML